MPHLNWAQLIDTLLNDQDAQRGIEAAEAISQAATENHVPELYELIRHPDFFVRETAARPLARLEGTKALPALFQAYTQGFRDGNDNDGLSAVIADVLEDNKRDSALLILGMLQDADDTTKANAAWAAGYVAPEVDASLLLNLLSDKAEPPAIRAAAAGSLASYQDNVTIVNGLIGALLDSSEQVRISAISALGYIGSKKAIEPLKAAQTSAASKREVDSIRYSLRQLKA